MNQIAIKREAREKIIQERGGTCQRCGVHPTVPYATKEWGKNRLVVHHILPRKQGGTDDPANLQVVCASCHSKLEGGCIIRIRWDLIEWLKKIDPSPTKALETLRSTYATNKETVEMLREIKEHILSR